MSVEQSQTSATNSILGDLFYGVFKEEDFFPFPKFTQEQRTLGKEMVDAVTKFAKDNIDSKKMDRAGLIPDEIVRGFAELGLMGLGVPEEFGGLNLDSSLYARVFSEVGNNDGSCATFLGAHQSIGYKALLNEGTPEQKKKWLPKLASGEVVASFCLTEPGSGSDAYSIKTKAKLLSNGDYEITGQKLWITNAGRSKFYTVFAKTEHKVDEVIQEKISCFIVESDFPGITLGEKEDKMGIRASETRAIFFDKVVVPAANLLGQPGKGFKIAMNVLNSGRLSLGSGCVGGIKAAIKMATNHAKTRQQFGKPISEFGLIQEKLAMMSARCYASECIVYLTTGKMIQGMKDYSLESAACKIYNSENLWITVDMSMQIAAGIGYMKDYSYEVLMRDARINLIFEGTNEILRCFIALSGIKGPGDDLKDLGKISDMSKVLDAPIKAFGVLTDFAKKRFTKMVFTKTLSLHHPLLEVEANDFSSMLSAFSIQVENALMKYGQSIIKHQLVQKRLAEMSIHLYVILAVISRTTSILGSTTADQNRKDYVLNLSKLAIAESRRVFMGNLKEMSNPKDQLIRNTAKYVVDNDGHQVDILED